MSELRRRGARGGTVLLGVRARAGERRRARQALRKVVTVVFCDLVDSTSLGERLDPGVAAAGDRALLRRDERGPRAPRGRRREVHRRRGHGRVRRTDGARGRRAARGAGRGRDADGARGAQRGAGAALRRAAPGPHRRQHGRGDRRRPLARPGLRHAGTPSTSPPASSRPRRPARSSSASRRSSWSATRSGRAGARRWISRARASRSRPSGCSTSPGPAPGGERGAHLAAGRPRARAGPAPGGLRPHGRRPQLRAGHHRRPRRRRQVAADAGLRGLAARARPRSWPAAACPTARASRSGRCARSSRRSRAAHDGDSPDEVRAGIARMLPGDDDAAVVVERVAGRAGAVGRRRLARGDLLGRPEAAGGGRARAARSWSSSRTSTGRSRPSSS